MGVLSDVVSHVTPLHSVHSKANRRTNDVGDPHLSCMGASGLQGRLNRTSSLRWTEAISGIKGARATETRSRKRRGTGDRHCTLFWTRIKIRRARLRCGCWWGRGRKSVGRQGAVMSFKGGSSAPSTSSFQPKARSRPGTCTDRVPKREALDCVAHVINNNIHEAALVVISSSQHCYHLCTLLALTTPLALSVFLPFIRSLHPAIYFLLYSIPRRRSL